ncbi:MAG: hypothetical protein [Bacteriophage sp.]|nr:MAG: hypothetical protein [Bacteriophage sp.]
MVFFIRTNFYLVNQIVAKIMCFIVKHTEKFSKLCPIYQQICIASAFFSAKKFVLLNKSIIFAVCFIVEHTRTGKQIKLSQQYGN